MGVRSRRDFRIAPSRELNRRGLGENSVKKREIFNPVLSFLFLLHLAVGWLASKLTM